MRRREFIRLLGSTAVLWSQAAGAQQKVRKVGIITAASRESFSGLNAAFMKGMRELGHIEGNDFIVEWRSAEEHCEVPRVDRGTDGIEG